MLGLGYDAVIPVAVDAAFRMDTSALELAIAQELEQGNQTITDVANVPMLQLPKAQKSMGKPSKDFIIFSRILY